MAQHADPHFFVGDGCDRAPHDIAYRTEAAVLPQLRWQLDSLGHHYDGEMLAEAFALLHVAANVVDGKGNFWNENHMRAPGHARGDRDPTRIAAHHFDHHHSMVRFRGGVDLVNRVGRGVHSRVETESEFGGGEIIVDGLGHAHDFHALLKKLKPNRLRAVASN